MATSLIGQTLGKTQITDLLGMGGMAAVYKGYQADIDRSVAVKVLTPLPEINQAFIERFKLEARTIARLQHPHILPVYDYGESNGLLYLVMAYISGGSLGELIQKGPLPLPTIERILRQVGSALDYAHRQGVIHRDIKPGNILLDGEGFALLADFGIVKLLTEGTSSGNLTNASGVIGTPAYMSPEQANGQPLDGRTDVYALGVVTYEMLTGRQPFSAETPVQYLIKHLTEPPPRLSEVAPGSPPALDIVLQRALAKNPDDRYQSATAFAEAFAQAISGTEGGVTLSLAVEPPATTEAPIIPPTQAPTTSTVTSPTRPTQSLPTFLMAGAALLALALAVVALLTANQRTPAVARATNTAPAVTQAVIVPTITSLPRSTPIPAVPSFGAATFVTTNTVGDSVNLLYENLAPAPPGTTYAAWLRNDIDDSYLLLGELSPDRLGQGFLSYVDGQSLPLPMLYNGLILTQETELGDIPAGDVLYIGQIPAAVMQALSEILLESEDGINSGSLLDGALTEAEIAQTHSGLAAEAPSLTGLHQHAEHTVNTLLGTRDDLDNNGRPETPGRGRGVAVFLDTIDARLNSVLDEGANADVEAQIEYVRVCLVNVRNWLSEALVLERALLAATTIEEVAAERTRSTEVITAMIDGIDLNQNGTVELFEGECALKQIGESGIIIASLVLRAAGER